MAVFSPATDPGAFAEQVLGQPLWDYQLDFARNRARYRVVCAGRQVGKSTTLATLALFEAATRRNVLVLVVSAGEEAAKRLLADCASLASNSSALASSVLDEGKSLLSFSNGSVIRSVPASGRQIRGNPVDLLIIDEAAFIANDIWQSAEPSIIARPGSRIVMTSSPWGGPERFFARRGIVAWINRMRCMRRGIGRRLHLPLVDEKLLEEIRKQNSEEYFRREFLAEWTDDSGSYFKESELMAAVADYNLTPPESLEWFLDGRYAAAGGVDWGLNDANVLTLVSPLEDYTRTGICSATSSRCSFLGMRLGISGRTRSSLTGS